MKILLLNPFDKTGGSTIRLRRFYKILTRLGYEVVYVESNSDLKDDEVISVAQKNNILGFTIGTIKRLKIMFSVDYDILFTQKLTPFVLPTLLVAKLFNKKIILDFDDWDSFLQKSFLFRYMFNLVENISYNIPDFYICASHKLEKLLTIKTKKPKVVISQGIDSELFNPQKYNKLELRKEFGFKENAKIVGFLGCFTPGGIGEFEKILESMKKIIEIDKDVFFLVIGGGRLLEKYKVNYKNFVFVGAVSYNEVPKYIAVCDVMVIWMKDDIGNKYKATLKIIEYLLMEKPVVGFLVGETKELFGRYCFLTENNIDSFVKTMLFVLRNYQKIKINSEIIRKEYSFDNAEKLLRQVIEKMKTV